MQIKINLSPAAYYFLLHEFRLYRRTLPYQIIDVSAVQNNLIVDKLYDLLHRPERFSTKIQQACYQNKEAIPINIRLPNWVADQSGYALSEEKMHRFNRYVERVMQERLFTLLDTIQHLPVCQTPGNRILIRDIIGGFIEQYGLQEAGMNYERLKKAYYRYRQDPRCDRTVPRLVAAIS